MFMYSKRLKDIRENKNITQKDIALMLKIERGLYSQYETEYFIIPLKHLITLSDYFSFSLDYIFGFNIDMNYKETRKSYNIELIKKRLKEFRKEHNLTQKKISTILNISNTTYSEYERGNNLIATPFLYTICKDYHISADYLLGKVDNPKYINN